MRRKDWYVSIAVGLALGLLFSVIGLSNTFLFATHASAAASVPGAVSLMADSQSKWSSANIKATTKWHTDNGIQVVNMAIQIQQPNQARLTIVQRDENKKVIVDYLWVTDGENIYEQNNLLKTYTKYAVPAFARLSPAQFASTVTNAGGTSIVRHPIAMLMPSPLADYIYPTGLAQRTGQYAVGANVQVQGRSTFALTWNNGSEKYWVDQQTGFRRLLQN